MSRSYEVKGYVDIRVTIDKDYETSNGATPDRIADIVKKSIENIFCPCEVIGSSLLIQK